MELILKEINTVTVIELPESLDYDTEEEFVETINLLFKAEKYVFVLDFTNLEYISSSCLGRLYRLSKTARNAGGRVLIANMSPKIQNIFELIGLNEFFEIYSSVEKAINSIAR